MAEGKKCEVKISVIKDEDKNGTDVSIDLWELENIVNITGKNNWEKEIIVENYCDEFGSASYTEIHFLSSPTKDKLTQLIINIMKNGNNYISFTLNTTVSEFEIENKKRIKELEIEPKPTNPIDLKKYYNIDNMLKTRIEDLYIYNIWTINFQEANTITVGSGNDQCVFHFTVDYDEVKKQIMNGILTVKQIQDVIIKYIE